MSTPLPHKLVRETVVDGEVMERESWVGDDGGESSGVVCSLMPGAMATFEVEARAPLSDALDGAVRMKVRGLLLSTPAETVPVLVTYDAVRGGIFFHASPPSFATDGVASGAGVTEEGDVEGGPAVTHLNNAFPGREVVSGVSLRSTASWESHVEDIVSSGPLVRATLTRRNVPRVSTVNGSVVEVRGRLLGVKSQSNNEWNIGGEGGGYFVYILAPGDRSISHAVMYVMQSMALGQPQLETVNQFGNEKDKRTMHATSAQG